MNSHYFSREEPGTSNQQTYKYTFGGHTYSFLTDTGVFSVGRMDAATDTLLRHIPPLSGSLLDMGCGCGCIGIVLAKEYGLRLTQADVNPRALRLSRENAERNSVSSNIIESDCFSQIEENFDTIVINPPIHAGKDVIFSMYEGSHRHLTHGGSLYIVIQKKHGAESSIRRLNEIFGNSDVLYKKKGCYIIKSSQLAIL